MMKIINTQGNIFNDNAELIVYFGKNGMSFNSTIKELNLPISSNPFEEEQPIYCKEIKKVYLIECEYIDQENYELHLIKIFDYINKNYIKTLATNGCRDINQQKLNQFERTENQNNRVEFIYNLYKNYLNLNPNLLRSLSFCCMSDSFTRNQNIFEDIFQEFDI